MSDRNSTSCRCPSSARRPAPPTFPAPTSSAQPPRSSSACVCARARARVCVCVTVCGRHVEGLDVVPLPHLCAVTSMQGVLLRRKAPRKRVLMQGLRASLAHSAGNSEQRARRPLKLARFFHARARGRAVCATGLLRPTRHGVRVAAYARAAVSSGCCGTFPSPCRNALRVARVASRSRRRGVRSSPLSFVTACLFCCLFASIPHARARVERIPRLDTWLGSGLGCANNHAPPVTTVWLRRWSARSQGPGRRRASVASHVRRSWSRNSPLVHPFVALHIEIPLCDKLNRVAASGISMSNG